MVRIVPATDAHVPGIVNVLRIAFANHPLEIAKLPHLAAGLPDTDAVLAFRHSRIRKRLQRPGAHLAVAVTDTLPGEPEKVVGFVGWQAPSPPDEPVDTDVEGVNIDALKYALAVVDKVEKEVLGDDEKKMWYLASLAIDPDFKGQGIGSQLVKWGTDKVDAAGVASYVVATPAAVGVYSRQGFKAERTLQVVRDNPHESFFMVRPAKA